MPKTPARAKQLFCARETFVMEGEALEQILTRAVKVLLTQAIDATGEEKSGATHEN